MRFVHVRRHDDDDNIRITILVNTRIYSIVLSYTCVDVSIPNAVEKKGFFFVFIVFDSKRFAPIITYTTAFAYWYDL